jgi:hypothetical protein
MRYWDGYPALIAPRWYLTFLLYPQRTIANTAPSVPSRSGALQIEPVKSKVFHFYIRAKYPTIRGIRTNQQNIQSRCRVSHPQGIRINDSVALIDKARRQIVIFGYGARDAMGEGIALAERLNAPVLTAC